MSIINYYCFFLNYWAGFQKLWGQRVRNKYFYFFLLIEADETEKILFLDDLYEIFSYDPQDFKNNTQLLPPKCDGSKFCEQVPYYPNDIIKKELKLKSDLKLLETKDEVSFSFFYLFKTTFIAHNLK